MWSLWGSGEGELSVLLLFGESCFHVCHRIPGWFGLEGTFEVIKFQPPAVSRGLSSNGEALPRQEFTDIPPIQHDPFPHLPAWLCQPLQQQTAVPCSTQSSDTWRKLLPKSRAGSVPSCHSWAQQSPVRFLHCWMGTPNPQKGSLTPPRVLCPQ